MFLAHVRTALFTLSLAVLASGVSYSGSIWAVDGSGCQRIHCYETSGGASQRTLTVTGSSCIIGIGATEDVMWVVGPRGCLKILKVDIATGDVLAEIPTVSTVCALSVAYGDGYLWVMYDNSRIARVDASTGEILGYVAPDFAPFPPRAAAYGDGYLWALVGTSCLRISKIDPATGEIVQNLDLPGTKCISAIAYGDGSLWVAGLTSSSQISRVDPSTGEVLSTASFGTGWYITDIAYQSESAAPPSAPVVTDDGAYVTRSDRLHASWTGDPDVVEYQYAIGRSPSDLIIGWTSAGTATDATETALLLSIGTPYYWYVKARNAAGQWSAVGASDGVVSGTPVRVSAAKAAEAGRNVVLSGVIVTARFDDSLYVESADRSSGIRVNGAAEIPADSTVDIAGTVHSAPDGNSIDPITWFVTGPGSVKPLGLTCRDAAAFSSAPTGLSTNCLLLRAWGRVTSIASGSFYVDDGSNVQNTSGLTGLRVLCGSIDPPAQDKLVLVTGIAGMFDSDGALLPGLRLRDSADLQVLD